MKTLAILLGLSGSLVPIQPAPIDGYVWGWQPGAANYFAATGYEYNSAGGPIEITRLGVGNYEVRFHDMAGAGGVAHASAYGANHLCMVSLYFPSGTDEIVRVRCFTTAGAAVDTRFVANVTNRKDPGSAGYLWNDNPTPPVAGHIPPAVTSYDSTGAPIVVYRSAVGAYQVQLGAFAQDSPALWDNGFLRVTPYGSTPKHCQVLDPAFQPDPDLIEVRCYDDTGFAVDTRFTLSYSRKQMTSATMDNTGIAPIVVGHHNPAGGAPTVVEGPVGTYQFTFPNAGIPKGHAIGSIMGTPPMFCNIHSWYPLAGAEVVNVRCYDGNVGVATPAMMLNVGLRS